MRTRVWLVVALLGAAVGLDAGTATAATTTAVRINGGAGGRVFDGVGAISGGGGGNSRLLVDYPEPQRSQLLDYLFAPDRGANVQVLKIEIGGDDDSTDGSEPSIEHVKGQVNCNVGYEFWLAGQARARNPGIKLYGLAWAAPAGSTAVPTTSCRTPSTTSCNGCSAPRATA